MVVVRLMTGGSDRGPRSEITSTAHTRARTEAVTDHLTAFILSKYHFLAANFPPNCLLQSLLNAPLNFIASNSAIIRSNAKKDVDYSKKSGRDLSASSLKSPAEMNSTSDKQTSGGKVGNEME